MQFEITSVEVAMLTGQSEHTIHQWIESGRLKARPISSNRYSIKIADLYKVMEQDTHDRSALLARIEALEVIQGQHQAQIQEAERQLDSLLPESRLELPTHMPSSQKESREPYQVRQTPSGLSFGSVPLTQFAEAHNVSHDVIQEQLSNGELDATPTPYEEDIQHWLSLEQQEKLIHQWNKTGKKYTMCQLCPHRSSI